MAAVSRCSLLNFTRIVITCFPVVMSLSQGCIDQIITDINVHHKHHLRSGCQTDHTNQATSLLVSNVTLSMEVWVSLSWWMATWYLYVNVSIPAVRMQGLRRVVWSVISDMYWWKHFNVILSTLGLTKKFSKSAIFLLPHVLCQFYHGELITPKWSWLVERNVGITNLVKDVQVSNSHPQLGCSQCQMSINFEADGNLHPSMKIAVAQFQWIGSHYCLSLQETQISLDTICWSMWTWASWIV